MRSAARLHQFAIILSAEKLQDDVARIQCADMCRRRRSAALRGPRRRICNSRSSAILVDAAFPAPEWDITRWIQWMAQRDPPSAANAGRRQRGDRRDEFSESGLCRRPRLGARQCGARRANLDHGSPRGLGATPQGHAESILVTEGNFTYVSINEQGHPQEIQRDGTPIAT